MRGDDDAPVGLMAGRVAEVIVTRADAPGSRGSGYRTTERTVLTAAHVVEGLTSGGSIRVRFDADRPTEWSAPARVVLLESEQDLAVLAIAPPADAPPSPPTRGGRVAENAAEIAVRAVGFPLFKMREHGDGRFRDSHDAHGTIAPLSNWRTGTLEVSVRPPDRTDASDASPWEGMSGAGVWADDRLIGVVTEHHHAEGPAMLTAARLDAPGLEAVREALGWPTDAQRLPAVGAQPLRWVAAYTYEVADLAPARLDDRDDELAQLATLAREGPAYTWWEAQPWAGKTALTSWFTLHHPADLDVVAYFVGAARAASSAFLEAMAEQLTVVTGRPPGGTAPCSCGTRAR